MSNVIVKLQVENQIDVYRRKMKSIGPIYNTHSLFLYTGIAEREQIEACFREAIKALGIPCRFKVNPVATSTTYKNSDSKNSDFMGYTFIWVSSPAVYYAFTGRNLNGSERVEYIPDDNWSPPGTPLEMALERIENESPKDFSGSSSWADMSDVEDKKIELEALYIRPIIKKNLDPLITSLKYRYTKEQKAYLTQQNQEKMEEKNGVYHELSNVPIRETIRVSGDTIRVSRETISSETVRETIPDFGSFVIHPSHIRELDSKYCPYILTAKRIPDFVTVENLKQIFRNYTTDPFKEVNRNVKGNSVTDTYPFIVIVDRDYKKYDDDEVVRSRTVFVTFDYNTNDAKFALQMVKRLEVVDPNNPCRKEIMYFDHSYNFPGK